MTGIGSKTIRWGRSRLALEGAQPSPHDLGASLGAIFGEIGIFAPRDKRTTRVVCVSDSDVYEMSESKVTQLDYRNPSFGLRLSV
jgi:hypothetical protein